MKMLDSNSQALSAYESEQSARQQSFESLLPQAESLLKEWVLDGETIGKPKQLAKLDAFVLADIVYENPESYGVDSEFWATAFGLYRQDEAINFACRQIQNVKQRAYAAWLTTPEASNALEEIVQYLEQCEEDLANER